MKDFTVREYYPPFLDVRVYGVPRPQGSKRAWAYIPKEGGKPKASMAEDNPAAVKSWREAVRSTVVDALPRPHTPVDGPIRVSLVFCLPKPASAPVRRRTWPHRKPDVDKLTRAVFDSLTDAGAWRDDSRCVELHVLKDFPGEGVTPMDRPGVLIRMWEVKTETFVPGSGPPPTSERETITGTVPLPGM